MKSIDLMQIVMEVEEGQAYKLTRKDMLGCAEGMLKSAFDDPPRLSDINDFVKKYLKYGGDFFCFKVGGDGDNGDHLMYLLDIYFEFKEQKG